MRLKNSLLYPIIALVIFTVVSTSLPIAKTSLDMLTKDSQKQTAARCQDIYFTIQTLINLETKHLENLAAQLSDNPEIATLITYGSVGGDRGFIDEGLAKYNNIAEGMLLTDKNGKEFYSRNMPNQPGEYFDVWGVDEALDGNTITTLNDYKDAESIMVLAPVRYEHDIIGLVVVSKNLSNAFAKFVANATHAKIAQVSTNDSVTVSDETISNHLSHQEISRTLIEKQTTPIIVHADSSQYVQAYYPIRIVDEQVCLIVEIDVSKSAELLSEKKWLLTKILLSIMSLALIFTCFLGSHIIRPLIRLKRQSLDFVRSLGLQTIETEFKGNELAVLTQTQGLMMSAIETHLSELTKSKRDLDNSKHMLQKVIDSLPQLICWKDSRGYYLGCNRNFINRLGCSFKDVIGKSDQEIPPASDLDLEQLNSKESDVLKSNIPLLNLDVELSNSPCTWFRVNKIPINDKYGESMGTLGTFEDVSEHKRLNKQLQEKQLQLIHTGRLNSLGEMATGIAHEINQPLTIIGLTTAVLEADQTENSPSGAHIDQINKQIERISAIIKNMRGFARLHNEEFEPADPKVPLENALSFFREQYRSHSIELRLDITANVPPIKLNSQKFEQVLVNLLSNARYAVDQQISSPELPFQKKISLSLKTATNGKTIIFKIKDNGIGMSPEALERCLEPFYTTKEVGQGTGLGLSISNNIINEFGGKIEVESVEGHGSLFRIILPIATPA
jgi:PAS domain S-box-containing protein